MPASDCDRALREVQAAFTAGRTKEAALAAHALVKKHPRLTEAWRLLRQAVASLGLHREALTAHRQAVNLEPGRVEDMAESARLLLQLERLPEAMNELMRAVRVAPAHIEHQEQLAELALRMQLPAVAQSSLDALRASGKASPATDRLQERLEKLRGTLAADPDVAHDLLVTHVEVCRLHGTGVLLERYLGARGKLVTLRSHSHYEGKTDLPATHLVLEEGGMSAEQEEQAIRQLLAGFKIRRILCIPFYEADARRAVVIQRLTGAPLCAYVMDDQTIYAKGVSVESARQMFEASSLRLVISPEMRAAYEEKFGLGFEIMPPLLTTAAGRQENRWRQKPGGTVHAALVGNVWSAQQFAQLRAFVRSAGLKLDWFGNAKTSWLPTDPKEYESDGIYARGFLPEAELARKLVDYPFVVVPSGQLDGSESNEWLTRLSLPSRMVFIMGQTMTPMLVIGHEATAASRFVSRFGLGSVVAYDAADPRAALRPLLEKESRQRILANIARCADKFVQPDAGAWLWRSLEAGRALPAPFIELYAETSQEELVPTLPDDSGPVVRPRTLNLQAIDVCNSRCVMCNIWKDGVRETMSLEQLRAYLKGSFFSEVNHVGITGGEPTLRKDLVELYRMLPECLPALKGASFISHGMQTAKAVDFYTRVHTHYRQRGLEFSGMISLDGVGAVHDTIRGRPGAFAAASKTLLELKRAGVKVMAACTIVRSNVYGLHELLEWGQANGIYVRFRVAEYIRRLYNDSCASEIRCFTDRELRHLVCFFHVLLTEYEREESIRRTYRSVIELLTGGERQIGCPYQKGTAVNINSRGELAGCAPKGDSFAPAATERQTHAILAGQRQSIARDHCARCIHDYHDDWNAAALAEQAGARAAASKLYDLPDENFTSAEVPAESLQLSGMKRILLAGWYGTETAGDIAILRGIMAEYLAVNPALQFTILSLYPAYTRTTVAAWPEDLRAKVVTADYLSQAALDSARDCDAVVMAGGPLMDIPDTRKILALFKLFADHGKPRVIEGCGVGPLNRPDLRWNVCRIARLATRITVRDSASRDLLRFYGIRKSIEVRSDPAATFLRAQPHRHHGSDRGVIRCFLRELTSEYPQALTPQQATGNLVQLLNRLLEWYPTHRIELWAMHHFPVGKDDRLFARELQRKVANPRLSVQWEPSTPEEIMAAMAAAEFCVCMRFHSCVFASEVGAPFFAIDYTAGGKIRGFLEDTRQEVRLCTLDGLAQLDFDGFTARVWPPAVRPASALVEPNGTGKPRVLHVIQGLTGGGAARALISLARYSRQFDGPEHAVVSLQRADEKGLELARAAGLQVLDQPGSRALNRALSEADIVLVHWWNCPELSAFFRRDLPPMRLALWVHVGGYHAPYLLTSELVNFVDSAVACSPHTFAHPAFSTLPAERGAMILAGAEFERLQGLNPRPHEGFRVGYIGMLDPTKMHPDYIAMSCAARVPDIRFVVCGSGSAEGLAFQAERLGRRESFEFPGAVENIRDVLETLDVYGYPLCEDTYAAAELNLQEVMFAGLPVVAFPYGGIAALIRHGETGLLVQTAEEYAAAIEYLHQHPEERARLGANAAAYAREHFGAEKTGREFNDHFTRMLALPKRERQWGVGPGFPPVRDPDREFALNPGARMFLESLGAIGRDYSASLQAPSVAELIEADNRIGGHTLLTHYTCAIHYRKLFPNDALLNFWAGLGFLARKHTPAALDAFQRARRAGFTQWRIHWYCAVTAEQSGRLTDALASVQQLLKAVPGLAEAKQMQQRLQTALGAAQASQTEVVAKAQAGLQTAQELLRRGRHAEAREALQRASDLIPGQLAILELMADLDCRLGRLPSARSLLDTILAREPNRDNPRLQGIRRALAEAKVQTGQLAGAR